MPNTKIFTDGEILLLIISSILLVIVIGVIILWLDIKHLKQQGLYDNSVIVIAADHQAHPAHLNMADSQVIDELPLYIINGGINSSNAWTGRCNQLDVYTTLLDIYGVRSTWRGLGHSLLNANYQEYNVERLQTLSDWIIRSNYFEMMRKH